MQHGPTIEQLREALRSFSRTEVASFLRSQRHPPPRFLYKYSSGSNVVLRCTVVRSSLWLSSRKDFNDPFELDARISIEGSDYDLRAYVRGVARRNGVPLGQRQIRARAIVEAGEFIKSAQNIYHENVDTWGICCFTDDPRSLQMWAYYGGSQKGVCFQFHTVGSPVPFIEALPVEYDDSPISINWIKEWTKNEQLGQSFFRKGKSWAHEREYRIVDRRSARTELAFAASGLTGVILGCQATKRTQQRVVAACRARMAEGLPAVRLYRAQREDFERSLRVARALDLEQLVSRPKAGTRNAGKLSHQEP